MTAYNQTKNIILIQQMTKNILQRINNKEFPCKTFCQSAGKIS